MKKSRTNVVNIEMEWRQNGLLMLRLIKESPSSCICHYAGDGDDDDGD